LYSLPKGKGFPLDIIDHDYSNLSNKIFSYFDIPYIVLQKEFVGYEQDYIWPCNFEKLKDFIKDNFEIEDEYEDEYLIAYRIKEKQPTDFVYLAIGDNWEKLSSVNKTRRIKNEASLKVYNHYSTAKNLSLSLEVQSPKNSFRTVSFHFDNELLGNYFVFDEATPINLVIPNIPTGENDIIIKITDYSKYGLGESRSASVGNISYEIIEKLETTTDLQLLDNSSNKSIINVSPFHSYYFQEARTVEGERRIGNHPLVSLEDFIVEDEEGNNILLNKLPLINELLGVDEEKYSELETYRDIREINYYIDNVANAIIDKNIGYIYSDNSYLNKKEIDKLSQHLNKYIPSLEIVKGSEFTVYRIGPVEKNNSIPFIFSSGWDILENKFDQRKKRKIKEKASLYLYSQDERIVELKFKSRTCSNETTFGSFEINEEHNKTFKLEGSDLREIALTSIHPLKVGLNQLTINIFSEQGQADQGTKNCPIWVSDISIYATE